MQLSQVNPLWAECHNSGSTCLEKGVLQPIGNRFQCSVCQTIYDGHEVIEIDQILKGKNNGRVKETME